MKKIIFLFAFVVYLTSCSSEKSCDTSNVSYKSNIKPIIDNYCSNCHGASFEMMGNNIKLDSYDLLKERINDVVKAVNHAPNFSPMPKMMQKLDDCDIKMLEAWSAKGCPNN